MWNNHVFLKKLKKNVNEWFKSKSTKNHHPYLTIKNKKNVEKKEAKIFFLGSHNY